MENSPESGGKGSRDSARTLFRKCRWIRLVRSFVLLGCFSHARKAVYSWTRQHPLRLFAWTQVPVKAPQGGPFFYNRFLMSPIPFLCPEQQEQFLREHQMIEDAPLGDEQRRWLESVNFHFLMGYARHYRDLIDEGHVDRPKRFSDIRGLVDTEAELAAFLTPWIRRAEWVLRAQTVKHFCVQQGTGERYLDRDHWTCRDARQADRLQLSMLRDILRHGEPYVTSAIKRQSERTQTPIPPWCDHRNKGEVMGLVQELPLWAVIDSFSIGTLGKFLRYCGTQPDGKKSVNDLVAAELGVPKRSFNKIVECFGITRNLLFHHQRLWMRPMPKSPGLSNVLERRYPNDNLKSAFKQAHFIALASISSLLPPSERVQYLDALDGFLERNPLYAIGIKRPVFAEFTPK